MQKAHMFKWTVIGAGPAGIAAVGKLIDEGVAPTDIAWVDQYFKVGDFGRHWLKVVSNTPVSMFMKFYLAFESFEFNFKDIKFMIERLHPDKKCPLGLAAEPLQWITNHLKNKATSFKDKAINIQYNPKGLTVYLENSAHLTTEKVILAIGARPKTLKFKGLQEIPFETAVNTKVLQMAVDENDVVAVFGSYQSARTIAENMGKTKAQKIVHFYRSERSFKAHVASIGLKESTDAIPITPENLLKFLPQCNKVIYAVGFERRALPIQYLAEDYHYDENTGQIAPGVFGLGIAFPEIIAHSHGREKYKVNAIYPILKHLNHVFPLWVDEPAPQIKPAGGKENIQNQVHSETSALQLECDEHLEVVW